MKSPLKISFISELFPVLILILAYVLAFYFYAHFPAIVISHWNIQGEPNGTLPRFWGAFGIPGILTIIYIAFFLLPLIDPRKDNYASFGRAYFLIRGAVLTALFLIYIAASLYNLGIFVPIKTIVPIIIGAMMIILGSTLSKIQNNWFIGIRTPWTLSSQTVWKKTHRIGGILFVVFGILLCILSLLPAYLSFSLFILGLILVICIPVLYSYILYKEEEKIGSHK